MPTSRTIGAMVQIAKIKDEHSTGARNPRSLSLQLHIRSAWPIFITARAYYYVITCRCIQVRLRQRSGRALRYDQFLINLSLFIIADYTRVKIIYRMLWWKQDLNIAVNYSLYTDKNDRNRYFLTTPDFSIKVKINIKFSNIYISKILFKFYISIWSKKRLLLYWFHFLNL